MSKINDGGQAFPCQMVETERGRFSAADWGCGGMTIRQWYAGQALAGLGTQDGLVGGTIGEQP